MKRIDPVNMIIPVGFVLMVVICCIAWAFDDTPPERVFCPQPDITAYEVALIIHNQHTAPEILYRDHPELLRQTAEQGKCAQ